MIRLPNELLLKIVSYCSYKDIHRFSITNYHYYELIYSSPIEHTPKLIHRSGEKPHILMGNQEKIYNHSYASSDFRGRVYYPDDNGEVGLSTVHISKDEREYIFQSREYAITKISIVGEHENVWVFATKNQHQYTFIYRYLPWDNRVITISNKYLVNNVFYHWYTSCPLNYYTNSFQYYYHFIMGHLEYDLQIAPRHPTTIIKIGDIIRFSSYARKDISIDCGIDFEVLKINRKSMSNGKELQVGDVITNLDEGDVDVKVIDRMVVDDVVFLGHSVIASIILRGQRKLMYSGISNIKSYFPIKSGGLKILGWSEVDLSFQGAFPKQCIRNSLFSFNHYLDSDQIKHIMMPKLMNDKGLKNFSDEELVIFVLNVNLNTEELLKVMDCRPHLVSKHPEIMDKIAVNVIKDSRSVQRSPNNEKSLQNHVGDNIVELLNRSMLAGGDLSGSLVKFAKGCMNFDRMNLKQLVHYPEVFKKVVHNKFISDAPYYQIRKSLEKAAPNMGLMDLFQLYINAYSEDREVFVRLLCQWYKKYSTHKMVFKYVFPMLLILSRPFSLVMTRLVGLYQRFKIKFYSNPYKDSIPSLINKLPDSLEVFNRLMSSKTERFYTEFNMWSSEHKKKFINQFIDVCFNGDDYLRLQTAVYKWVRLHQKDIIRSAFDRYDKPNVYVYFKEKEKLFNQIFDLPKSRFSGTEKDVLMYLIPSLSYYQLWRLARSFRKFCKKYSQKIYLNFIRGYKERYSRGYTGTSDYDYTVLWMSYITGYQFLYNLKSCFNDVILNIFIIYFGLLTFIDNSLLIKGLLFYTPIKILVINPFKRFLHKIFGEAVSFYLNVFEGLMYLLLNGPNISYTRYILFEMIWYSKWVKASKSDTLLAIEYIALSAFVFVSSSTFLAYCGLSYVLLLAMYLCIPPGSNAYSSHLRDNYLSLNAFQVLLLALLESSWLSFTIILVGQPIFTVSKKSVVILFSIKWLYLNWFEPNLGLPKPILNTVQPIKSLCINLSASVEKGTNFIKEKILGCVSNTRDMKVGESIDHAGIGW